jgi:hypothetical protein
VRIATTGVDKAIAIAELAAELEMNEPHPE